MVEGLILVGVDGSAGSSQALLWAADRASAAGARLRVVTAWETPVLLGVPAGAGITVPTDAEMIAMADALLDDAVAVLSNVDGVNIERSVRRGRPGRAILEEAEACAPDLVAVGTHGHSVLTRVLLGSVSRYVATHAPCPVAVVPESSPVGSTKPVRVGVDGSPGGRSALRWVAHHTACPLELVHVWDVPHLYGVPDYPADDVERFAKEQLDALVDDLAADARDRVTTRVERGDPREILLADTDAIAAIVVGRRRGGPLASLLGSVSVFVASHADVPVLVVPPDEHIDTVEDAS